MPEISNNNVSTGALNKLQYIDLTRGIAILGVLAVHSEQKVADLFHLVRSIFNYGQLGVQLFFIASAITLCLSMKERRENSSFNFYVRRYFRIAPLYYTAIVFYFIWRIFFSYVESGLIAIHEKYSFLGVFENLLFLHGFDPRNFSFVVPGGWSIAAEMCFYAVFPLLFSMQLKMGFEKFFKFSIFMIGISFFAQFLAIDVVQPRLVDAGLLKKVYVNDEFGFIYCTILNQLSVFLIGIMTFQKLQDADISKYKLAFAIFLCCVSCFLLNTKEFKTGYNGFVYPILSSIAFSIFLIKISVVGVFVSLPSRLLIKIGEVSFSMYLLHFFVLDLISIAYENSLFQLVGNPEVRLVLLFSSLVVFTYFCARISYEFLEKPAISYGRRFIRD